ncbi:MAG: phosphorylcholine transferase LicD [Anaeroplasma sp.]
MEYLDKENEEKLKCVHLANFELLKEADRIFKQNNIEYFMIAGTLIGAVRHHDFIPWDDDVDIAMTRDMFNKMLSNHVLDQIADDFEAVYPDEDDCFFDMIIKINYKKSRLANSNEETKFYNEKHNKISLDIFVIDKTYKGLRGKIQRLKLKMIYGEAMSKRYSINFSKYTFFEKIKIKVLCFFGKNKSMKRLYEKYVKVSSKYNDRDLKYCFSSNDLLSYIDVLYMTKFFEKTIDIKVRDKMLSAPIGYDEYLTATYGNYMELPPIEKRIPLHINFDELFVEKLKEN